MAKEWRSKSQMIELLLKETLKREATTSCKTQEKAEDRTNEARPRNRKGFVYLVSLYGGGRKMTETELDLSVLNLKIYGSF
jgi:hypothetical protein